MIDDRPYLQIPLPSEEDMRLYEEWAEKQKDKKQEEIDKDTHVVIIDI
jgi:hypothetical protein